jgi:hypothetical protein
MRTADRARRVARALTAALAAAGLLGTAGVSVAAATHDAQTTGAGSSSTAVQAGEDDDSDEDGWLPSAPQILGGFAAPQAQTGGS